MEIEIGSNLENLLGAIIAVLFITAILWIFYKK